MSEIPKLLIVDDDPGIRSQLKWGVNDYEVFTADGRTHALRQFNKHIPPVVTLDLGLPPDVEGVSEGYKILSQILEKAPDTNVIVVSGSEEKINSVLSKQLGAFDFYAKPIDLVKLIEIINRAYRDYQTKTSK